MKVLRSVFFRRAVKLACLPGGGLTIEKTYGQEKQTLSRCRQFPRAHSLTEY